MLNLNSQPTILNCVQLLWKKYYSSASSRKNNIYNLSFASLLKKAQREGDGTYHERKNPQN
jgi:hypothetical protein